MMMPYNLQYQGDSKEFYEDIADFSAKVLEEGEKYRSCINRYSVWTAETGLELRTDLEYLLEFLSLGVYFNAYCGKAARLLPFSGLLQTLAKHRLGGKVPKAACDLLKGVVLTLFYSKARPGVPAPDVLSLNRVLIWMRATGEFKFEVEALQIWVSWLQTLPTGEAGPVIQAALDFADWFELAGAEVLGKYTAGLAGFLAEELPRRRWREDIVLCGRSPGEYYLNMLGSEILNWAYRRDFMEANQFVVLLPRCMCMAGRNCRAAITENGFQCMGCTGDCQVAIISALGRKKGFMVFIIPHESGSFARWNRPNSLREGVIGIACATRLIDGGLKVKAMGLPAQCVLLDSCGCQHWFREEKVTRISLERLEEILNISQARVMKG